MNQPNEVAFIAEVLRKTIFSSQNLIYLLFGTFLSLEFWFGERSSTFRVLLLHRCYRVLNGVTGDIT